MAKPNDHISACGANFMVSDEYLETDKVPYAGIEPGTKLLEIGTKRRSKFSMKNPYWMRYDGIHDDGKYRYMILRSEFMDELIDGRYWCYAFIILEKSENRLYVMNRDYRSGSDLVIDGFKIFKDKNQNE